MLILCHIGCNFSLLFCYLPFNFFFLNLIHMFKFCLQMCQSFAVSGIDVMPQILFPNIGVYILSSTLMILLFIVTK